MSIRKGSHYERELLHFLDSRGFAVIRVAGSGGDKTPVDIVAIKRGLVIGIECKAWAQKPKLNKERTERFKDWCERAGAIGFLAWRTTGKWLFLQMKHVTNRNYEDENWIEMESLLAAFGIL